MSHSEHLKHIKHIKEAADIVKDLHPLREKKSPAKAFIMGLLLGALGVAIYFKSAKDFFVCLGLFFILTLMMPWGPGEVFGWFFSPLYGAWRARTSNQKLLPGHR